MWKKTAPAPEASTVSNCCAQLLGCFGPAVLLPQGVVRSDSKFADHHGDNKAGLKPNAAVGELMQPLRGQLSQSLQLCLPTRLC